MTKLKLIPIGTSTGVVLPKEMLTRMNVGKGNTLYAIEAADGGYLLTPYDPKKIEKADEIMRRYRNTLRALANN